MKGVDKEERQYLLEACDVLESGASAKAKVTKNVSRVGLIERRRRERLLQKFYKDQNELSSLYEKDAQMLDQMDTKELIKQGHIERKKQLVYDRYSATLVFVSNFIILCANLFASIVSGSFSIISIFIDSMIDLLSSITIHLTVHAINNTNKFNYPGGRPQLGVIAIIGCSVCMAVANVMLIIRSIEAIIFNEVGPDVHTSTLILMLSSIFIKFIIMVICYQRGTKNSRMLALDQRNDAITSAVGIAGAYIGDKFWVYADPVGAILVCTFVAWSWFENAVEQIPLVVGKRLPKRELSRVLTIAVQHDERIKTISYATIYHVGERAQVELHITLDASSRLHIAHKISESLRDKINALDFVERSFIHFQCDE